MSIQVGIASYVLVPIASISSLVAIITIIIAGYLVYHFIFPQKKRRILKANGSENKKQIESSKSEINQYAVLSATVCVFGNAGCSFFNAIYCIHLLFDPYLHDEKLYKHHYSHFLRIISTVCWYIGTIAIIWFFNGRLFYAFKDSFYKYSRKKFIATNVFVTVMGVISLIVAYFGVYIGNLVIAEIAFNSFRISYQIITLIVLYMFSRRLLFLTLCQHSIQLIKVPKQIQMVQSAASSSNNSQAPMKPSGTGSNIPTLHVHPYQSKDSVSDPPNEKPKDMPRMSFEDLNHSISFLKLTAQNAVLVFVTSASVLLVTFFWFAFRFIILPQTRLTLLIPMNMASIDALIGSISVIMLFHFGGSLNEKLCNRCNQCFINVCVHFAIIVKKQANNDN